jgi:hypothetical protein
LATTLGYAGPSDLEFTTQVHMQHGSIPDLVGATPDGAGVLLVESKFWAPLTPNQPTGYLRQLPGGGGGMVLFVAPGQRYDDLWSELVVRCQAEGLEVTGETGDPLNWRAGSASVGQLAYASWSFVLDHLEGHLKEAGADRGAHEVWQLKELCRRLEDPPSEDPSELQSIVDEVARRLPEDIFDTRGYGVGRGARFYRRYGTVSGHVNWFVGYSEEYAERFTESLLWVGGPSGDTGNREVLPMDGEGLLRSYVVDKEILFPLDVPTKAAREVVIRKLATQVEGIMRLLPKQERP